MDAEKRSIKGPLILLLIISIFVVALFAIPFGVWYFISNNSCGENGILIGSFNEGWYCYYNVMCEDCQNSTQCPECGQFCESRSKVKRDGYCGPTEIDITNAIKVDNEGNVHIEKLPLTCNCCCEEPGGN